MVPEESNAAPVGDASLLRELDGMARNALKTQVLVPTVVRADLSVMMLSRVRRRFDTESLLQHVGQPPLMSSFTRQHQ